MRTPLLVTVLMALATAAAASPASPNKRLLCGCASSRFLGPATTTVGERTLGAWLHGDVELNGFQPKDGGGVSPAVLPFQVVPDDKSSGMSRLVTVRATDKGDGLLGIVRHNEPAPRDVRRVQLVPGGAAPSTSPVLAAAWLEPVEVRDRRDCGVYATQRLAFEAVAGSAPVEAFEITDATSHTTTLVDARHVGAFGIGRVEVCEHGAPVATVPTELTITPVSATGVRGEPWGFAHDGTGTTAVRRTSSPASADADRIAMPFPVPGEPTRPMSWLSVGGLWIAAPAFGALCALIAFVVWRLKRRKLVEVRCVACHGTVAIDVLDQQTDGFFCPHCGAAGYWKGKGVDVDSTRL